MHVYFSQSLEGARLLRRSETINFPTVYQSDCEVLRDRKSTRLNSSHGSISYAVFCLKKKIIANESGLIRIKKKWNNKDRQVCADQRQETYPLALSPGLRVGRVISA